MDCHRKHWVWATKVKMRKSKLMIRQNFKSKLPVIIIIWNHINYPMGNLLFKKLPHPPEKFQKVTPQVNSDTCLQCKLNLSIQVHLMCTDWNSSPRVCIHQSSSSLPLSPASFKNIVNIIFVMDHKLFKSLNDNWTLRKHLQKSNTQEWIWLAVVEYAD